VCVRVCVCARLRVCVLAIIYVLLALGFIDVFVCNIDVAVCVLCKPYALVMWLITTIIYLSIYLSICLSVCLSVCLSMLTCKYTYSLNIHKICMHEYWIQSTRWWHSFVSSAKSLMLSHIPYYAVKPCNLMLAKQQQHLQLNSTQITIRNISTDHGPITEQ